jgi:hypothetical protein
MYRKEGGAFPDPLLNLTWDYIYPDDPDPEEMAKEMNGRALTDLKDPSGQTLVKAGQQLSGFAQLRDDGSTMSGCWIFSGSYTQEGNQMARRDASDPREAGIARTGPGRGRPIAASSTTAPAPIRRANHGTRRNQSSSGTAPNGSALTCRTTLPPRRPRTSAPSS